MPIGLCRPQCSSFGSNRSSCCMKYSVLNAPMHSRRRPLVLCSGFKQQLHPVQEPISSIRFEEGLQLLTSWKLQYGSCYVPKSASDAVELQQWISEVRKAGKSGYLTTEQQQQLDQAEFVWKQNVVDAKWHSNYHRLRCWLHDSHGSLQQLLQHSTDSSKTLLESTPLAGLQAAGSAAAELQLQDDLALHTALSSDGQLTTSQNQDQQQASDSPQPQHQQLQAHQQLPPDMHEVAVWLQRQIVLYNKLKLTPVKVHMLRQLGVKLKRQAGFTKPNLHPLLMGQNPDTFRRRPIVVTPATRRGKQVVADILRRHNEQHGQGQSTTRPQQHPHIPQQQQQQGQTARSSSIQADSLGPGSVSPATSSAGASTHSSITTAASIVPAPGNGSSGSSSSRAGISEPDRVFMFRLADLQRWKKRHGSCYVPLGIPDAPELADWVQQVRALRADAADSSSSSAAPPQQQQQQQLLSQQDQQQQQQQQHHQHERHQLAQWQLQELEAVGFIWKPKQDVEQWYAMYHQLRHFKQRYHHIRLPGIQEASAVTGSSTISGPAEADEAANSSSSSSSSRSRSSSGAGGGAAEWGSLTAWLQQQEVEYAAGKLSRMQQKLLKGLGWQPGGANTR